MSEQGSFCASIFYLSIHLSACLSTASLRTCIPTTLSKYILVGPIYLSICLSIYLSIYLFVYYLSIYLLCPLSICSSVDLAFEQSIIYLSQYYLAAPPGLVHGVCTAGCEVQAVASIVPRRGMHCAEEKERKGTS